MPRWLCFLFCLLASPAVAADVVVPAGADLQAAIDKAACGDHILLTSDHDSGDGWVLRPQPGCTIPTVIRTRGVTVTARVDETRCLSFARVRSTNRGYPVFKTVNGTNHWRVEGLRITPAGGNAYGAVALGDDGRNPVPQTRPEHIPQHLEIVGNCIYPTGTNRERRGITTNAGQTLVKWNHVTRIADGSDGDAVAVGGWNGTGPVHVVDNYLCAATEVVIFGGGDPSIVGQIYDGNVIERNTLTKDCQPAWRTDDSRVKNLFELKNAKNTTVRDNAMHGNWAKNQDGFAALITIQNQDGNCPWCTIEGVLFERNRIWATGQCWQISGRDAEGQASGVMRRVVIRNNVCETGPVTEVGQCITITGTPHDFLFENNTCINHGTTAQIAGLVGSGSTGMVFRNNLFRYAHQPGTDCCYGFKGSDVGEGIDTFATFWAPDYVWQNNALATGIEDGSDPRWYPAGSRTTMPSQAEFERCFVAYQMPYTVKPDGPCAGMGAVLSDKPPTP